MYLSRLHTQACCDLQICSLEFIFGHHQFPILTDTKDHRVDIESPSSTGLFFISGFPSLLFLLNLHITSIFRGCMLFCMCQVHTLPIQESGPRRCCNYNCLGIQTVFVKLPPPLPHSRAPLKFCLFRHVRFGTQHACCFVIGAKHPYHIISVRVCSAKLLCQAGSLGYLLTHHSSLDLFDVQSNFDMLRVKIIMVLMRSKYQL